MSAILRPDATAVLRDRRARASLGRYFDVMQNDKAPKFMISRKLASCFRKSDSTLKLWKIHGQLLKQFCELEKTIDSKLKSLEEFETPSQTFLDLKVEIANRILEKCHFCARRCGLNRKDGKLGYCGCGTKMMVSSMFKHFGEEPELVPSGTIFTLGCTMRCRHCQNWTISQWMEPGETYSPQQLASAIERLRSLSCRNINLVGGDPTPWLTQWLETFRHVKVGVPVVWNSNSYYSSETAQLLAGFSDIYLLDFKYGNNKCATHISGAANYLETCISNHLYGKKYGELLIRVLVLPNHLHCCTEPILEWISRETGFETRTNIMFQYRPEWRAHEIPELRRRLTHGEKQKAIQLAKRAKLVNFIT